MATPLEIIESCAAGGAVLVAGFTGWLAYETRQVTRGDYRSRVDSLSHRVTVLADSVRSPCWWEPSVMGRGGEPNRFAQPLGLTTFDLTSGKGHLLLVRGYGAFFNEGDVSALIRVSDYPTLPYPRFLFVGDEMAEKDGDPRAKAFLPSAQKVWGAGGINGPAEINQGEFVLPPQSFAVFRFLAGKDVSSWIRASQSPGIVTPNSTETLAFDITSQAPAGACDHFELSINAWPLVQLPGQEGWVVGRLGIGTPEHFTVRTPTSSVQLVKRTYPNESQKGRRRPWRVT